MGTYYDAVVVGAGPAGCAAARRLAAEGFKVLLVERERLPREKACAGFLSPEGLRQVEEQFGPLPAGCLASNPTARGALLLLEGGEEYDLPFSGEGAIVRRSAFDRFLAEASGAEIMDGWEVESIDLSRFRVALRLRGDRDEKVVEATYLVGADGARSLVLEFLRPEFHRLYALPGITRMTVLEGEADLEWDPSYLGLARWKGGGATFFLKDGALTIAAWGREDAERRAQEILEKRLGLSISGGWRRQVAYSNRMARDGVYCLGAGCALLAGEAAGLVDPWGHGLRLALQSGKEAAEAILDSVGENITPHVLYTRRMKPLLMENDRQRKNLGGIVGDLDTGSLGQRSGSPWRKATLRRLVFGRG